MGIFGDVLGGVGNLAGGIAGAAGDAVGKVAGGLGGIGGGLLKLVLPQVDGVLGQITQSQNMIQDLVKSPMNAMLKEVEDGQIWRGPGADAFKQDITSAFLPEVDMINNLTENMGKWLRQSKDAIQQADDDALKEIEGLLDFIDT